NVVELNNWLATVSLFKNCLKDVLSNDELLDTLGYKDIINDNLQEISDFSKTLKEKITEKIGQEKLNAPLSEAKIQNFESKSNEIITNAFEIYNEIFIKLDEN